METKLMSTQKNASRRPRLAVDLDGTVFEHTPGTDYNNPLSILFMKPVPAVCMALMRAHIQGWQIIVVTGRSRAVLRETRNALYKALGFMPTILVQAEWRGIAALKEFKTYHLSRCGALMYIGDSKLDRTAAKEAGILFRSPEMFAAHGVPAPEVSC